MQKTSGQSGRFKPFLMILIGGALIAGLGINAARPDGDRVKLAVFDFIIGNIEASGYGSNVTNQLMHALGAYPLFAITDRKELEIVLAQNEFQQNDKPQNIYLIGNRLGLEFIIVGKVSKQNANLIIHCKVYRIDRQIEIFNEELTLLGDARLSTELKQSAERMKAAIVKAKSEPVASSQPAGPQTQGACILTAKPGRSKVTLYWQAPDAFAAVAYRIYRANAEAGPFVKIGQTNESQFQDTEVEAKTRYFYKIKAYDAKGSETAFSVPVQAGLVPTPEPPIILKAESHVKSITVFWTPNPTDRPDAGMTVAFHVYRCQGEEGPPQKIGRVEANGAESAGMKSGMATFSFVDQSLEDGTEYYYTVTASNPLNHESDFSRRVGQRTVARVEKVEVEGERIRAVKLKWQAVETLFAKGYVIYRSQTAQEGFREIHRTAETGTREFFDKSGLEDECLYYYYITVYEDQSRQTAPSAVVTARTKGPPATPDRLEAQGGLVRKVKLQWMPLADEEAAGYKIYRASGAAGPFQLIATLNDRTTDTYTDAGPFLQPLEDDAVYFYRLTVFNSVQAESRTQAEASARTKARPHKPEGLQAGGLQVRKAPLAWQANKEEDIVHYRIFRKESGSGSFMEIAKTGAETAFLDTDLKTGAEYIYQIKAEDKDGLLSEASDPVTVRAKPRPQIPQGLKVRYENKEAILSWQPNPETDIASYAIYERFLILVSKVASAPGTEYRFSGLSPGSSKTVFITAVDQDGLESEYSPPITFAGP